MALRRGGTRFSGSIWPGFVDALTALLLILMFVLSIFMIVQFSLREQITGQDRKLDALTNEVAARDARSVVAGCGPRRVGNGGGAAGRVLAAGARG